MIEIITEIMNLYKDYAGFLRVQIHSWNTNVS